LNFTPLFLLTFIRRVTSNVFTSVTIGTGDDIHMLNALARILSWGLISFFIIQLPIWIVINDLPI
jgi:hypothetical protein